MSPFIRIFSPNGEDRFEFLVVVFQTPDGTQVHAADTCAGAEQLAEELARRHCCEWKHEPPLKDSWNAHWFDENGDLRDPNRVEFERLENGVVRFSVFSDSHRISTDIGRSRDLPEFLSVASLLMGD